MTALVVLVVLAVVTWAAFRRPAAGSLRLAHQRDAAMRALGRNGDVHESSEFNVRVIRRGDAA